MRDDERSQPLRYHSLIRAIKGSIETQYRSRHAWPIQSEPLNCYQYGGRPVIFREKHGVTCVQHVRSSSFFLESLQQVNRGWICVPTGQL